MKAICCQREKKINKGVQEDSYTFSRTIVMSAEDLSLCLSCLSCLYTVVYVDVLFW